MKTIFLFTDSRLTDLFTVVAAVGEDGELVMTTKFDEGTTPHCRFAMGMMHELPEDMKLSVMRSIHETREMMLREYSRTYGASGWIPVWIDSPHDNAACLNALRLRRERLRKQAEAAR